MNEIPRCNQGRETMGVIRQAILNVSEHFPTGSEGISHLWGLLWELWEMGDEALLGLILSTVLDIRSAIQAPSVPGSWRTGHFHQQTWILFSSSFSVNAPRVHIVFQKQNPRFTSLLSPTDNCHCNKSQASRVSEDMQCSGNAGGRSLECPSAVVRAASILEGLEG